ncbi:MAG: L,D-transpeptidase [Rhizobiaceae bacterium]
MLKPIKVTTAILLALSTAAFSAQFSAQASERYGKRPKLSLSADLVSPWMLQLKPRSARKVRSQNSQKQRASLAQRRTGITTGSLQQNTGLRGSVKSEFKPDLAPTIVNYSGPAKPGTIIVNTPERRLYLIEPGGKARRYAVGVGKPGFEWAGAHKVTRKAQWPSWRPPQSMIERERKKGRELPSFMEGGVNNPLGARALYLGSSIYRIHGTNQAWSIGKAVSSGCIRMRNEDVMDLYDRVPVGARVKVI